MSKELEALDVIMTALAQNTLLAENDKGYILRMPRVKREREELCKTFDYDLIRQALQRLEAIENSNPSEALECLEEIIHEFYEPHYELSGEYSYKNELLRRCENEVSTIKQALIKSQEQEKVLDILFKKNVWVARLKGLFKKYNNDLDVLRIYNANMPSIDYQLTQEEFDLLKRYCDE